MAGHRIREAEAARRRTVFLHELARTANGREAARVAGCSTAWLYAQRRCDPLFAGAWDRALADAEIELDVKHEFPSGASARVTRRTPGGRMQEIDRRKDGWSARKERLFLDTIVETSNVLAAARAAGVAPATCYKRRRLWPDFARAWDTALCDARTIFLAKMQRQAMNGVRDDEDGRRRIAEADEDAAVGDPSLMMTLLKYHQATTTGEGKRMGRIAAPPSIEDVTERIIAKVAAIKRQRGNAREDVDSAATHP